MGIDWIRRSEQKFKHRLQEATQKGLALMPLLPAAQESITTYPCQWLRDDRVLPVKTRLTIFQRSEKAKVAVLDGVEAVAEVIGEASADLKQIFKAHPELCNVLPVKIVKVGKPNETFYVQPITRSRKAQLLQ